MWNNITKWILTKKNCLASGGKKRPKNHIFLDFWAVFGIFVIVPKIQSQSYGPPFNCLVECQKMLEKQFSPKNAVWHQRVKNPKKSAFFWAFWAFLTFLNSSQNKVPKLWTPLEPPCQMWTMLQKKCWPTNTVWRQWVKNAPEILIL